MTETVPNIPISDAEFFLWRDRDRCIRHMREQDEKLRQMQAALDSAEIKGGITDDGNLWRFWSDTANKLAVKCRARDAEIAKLTEGLREVEKWWLEKGMHELPGNGAPYCIFLVRSLLKDQS